MRAWAMSASNDVLCATRSGQGMSQINRDQFETALLDMIGHTIAGPTEVVACGMVGSREGWVEAPYDTVPCPTMPAGFAEPKTTDPRLQVFVIPGIRQDSPPDVMRGEETQITGFLARNPNWDGVICLPGTHTKWVHISANEVVSFQTFMTGELFAALSQGTVLRHAVAQDGWDDAAFHDGLDQSLSRPERLASRLFTLRADRLLNNADPVAARAHLSGLLIGAELAGAKPYWLGQQIAVIGEGKLAKLYVDALATQAAPAVQVNATEITLAGLTVAHNRLRG